MTRFKRVARTVGCQSHNLLAILISFAAVSLLYFNFEPTPAGADHDAARTDVEALEAAASFSSSLTIPESPGTGAGNSDAAEQAGREELRRRTLLVNLLLLEKGAAWLRRVPSYSATFYRRERVNGRLLDPEVMQVKLRHEPFSVYMKWLVGDKGRELLYVDGKHDGNMLVHAGGWKARLLPALKLDPEGSIAMRESRHPVTMAGLLPMVQKMIDHRRRDLDHLDAVDCRMVDDQEFEERPCYAFVLKYLDREVSETYRKSIVYIDKGHSIPVFVKNFGWPFEDQEIPAEKLDEETLIELYHFTDLDFQRRLASADFSRENEQYQFRR